MSKNGTSAVYLSLLVFFIASLGASTFIAAQTISSNLTSTSTPSIIATTTPGSPILSSLDQITSATSTLTSLDSISASSTKAIAAPTGLAAIVATTIPAISVIKKDYLTCQSAYTSDLYDTPSGHLSIDIYGLPNKSGVSKIIGQQSWEVCKDTQGNQYEFKLTAAEYATLAAPNGTLLTRFLSDAVSAGLMPAATTTAPVVVDSTSTPTSAIASSTATTTVQ